MGLDQYAYVAAKSGAMDDYYSDNSSVTKPREISYWRKHPNLQGWMERLWIEKGYPGLCGAGNKFDAAFNGIELELTWEDLNKLETDIKTDTVASLGTTGFFFGDASDSYYREKDLQFIKAAKAELFLGLKVFYNSSW